MPEELSYSYEFVHNARWLWIWLIAVVLYARWLYRKESELTSRSMRALLVTLRVLAIMIPLVFLYEPQKTWEETTRDKSTLLVMLDRSMSMQVAGDEFTRPERRDRALQVYGESLNDLTRWDRQRALIESLQDKVGEGNKIRLSTYGAGLGEIDPSDAVSWDAPLERHTRLGLSLNHALGRMRGETLAGVVIFGDGNVSDADEAARVTGSLQERRKPVPVFTMGLGSPEVVPDIRVESFNVPEVVVKSDDKVTFKGYLSSRGLEVSSLVEVQLLRNGDPVESREIPISGQERDEVVFELVLDDAGEFDYTLEAATVDGEKVVANNSKTAKVVVKDEKLKVLYVDDQPRWDYHKISQFLERNPKIYESSMLLIKASPKYEQKGSKKIRSLPATFEGLWESVDVVILGDVGIKYFTGSTFLDDLERFVSKGGGLVFLAGALNNPASYSDSPLENLLPVVLAPDSMERLRGGGRKDPFSVEITDAGLGHPITRMGDSPELTAAYWRGIPPFLWTYVPNGVKPLTRTLLQHPELTCRLDGSPVPVVSVMNYGKGQVLWVGSDEIHRWSYLDDREYVVNRFLSQFINYMSTRKISGTTGRYLLEVGAEEVPLGDAVEISLQFDDPGAISETSLELKWSIDEGDVRTLRADRESSDSGLFRARWEPDRRGTATIWLDDAGQAKTIRVTDFSRELVDAELKPDVLARFSGAADYHEFDGLDALVDKVRSRQVVQTRLKTESLLSESWVWWILGLLMLTLGAEWWIRKRLHLL